MKRAGIILLALIILVGVCKIFKQENTKFYKGVDISPHDNVDEKMITKFKESDVKFIYILFGISEYDYTAFARKTAELCQKNQIHYGYYFVTDATSDTQIQRIKKFLSEDNSKYNSFPLVLDYEIYENDEGIDKPRIEGIIKMCQTLKVEGYDSPWIYMPEVIYHQCPDIMEQYPEQCFWLANYSVNKNTLEEYPRNIAMLQYERGKNIMEENIFKKYVQ